MNKMNRFLKNHNLPVLPNGYNGPAPAFVKGSGWVYPQLI